MLDLNTVLREEFVPPGSEVHTTQFVSLRELLTLTADINSHFKVIETRKMDDERKVYLEINGIILKFTSLASRASDLSFLHLLLPTYKAISC